MKNSLDPITIDNCCDGALAEMFDNAIAEVIHDTLDRTKERSDARTITLTVTIRPEYDGGGAMDMSCTSRVKLAKRVPVQSKLTLTESGEVLQHRSTQEEFEFDAAVGS